MSFTTPIFFVFLPAVLLLYRQLPHRLRMPLLLAASYLFYAYYDWRLLILIFITTAVSYAAARYMSSKGSKKQRRPALILTMCICLGILFIFKYFNFAVGGIFALSRLFGANADFKGFDIILPMGISFYVFQTMSYVFDVYYGKITAEKNIGFYGLFVVFFPQLVAGPIERPGDLLPQLKASLNPNRHDLSQGMRLLLRGYAKKLLIADFIAGYVDNAYNNPGSAGGMALAVATVLFAVQIYCDFSGYSDIALGCGRLMGIKLTTNFNEPYRAVTIRDFWRRWHISLTRWFTDYLYIPLGGSHKGLVRQCINIIITFLVSGLWHGASLTFIVWGGLHGIYLAAETLILRGRQLSSKSKIPGRIITFLLVCFAWIFFRAGSITDAFGIIRSIAVNPLPGNFMSGLGISQLELITTAALIILLPFIDRLMPLATGSDEAHAKVQHKTALIYMILILAIIICRCLVLTDHGATAFIYFQF